MRKRLLVAVLGGIMAATQILGGELANVLARGTVSLSTGGASALYPVDNVFDGVPGRPWVADTAYGTYRFDCDGDLISNGGMELWNAGNDTPTGWTAKVTGTATISRSTTKNAGAYAARLQVGDGSAALEYKVRVRAGERLRLTFALRGDGAMPSPIFAEAQDLSTGLWLNDVDGGYEWVAGEQNFYNRTDSTYATTTIDFVAPSIDDTGRGTTTLRLKFKGQGYVDDVYLWPHVNLLSLHGHNLPTGATVSLLSGDDGATFGTDHGDLAVSLPACYLLLGTAATKRYLRVEIADPAAEEPLRIGEMVLGHAEAYTRAPDYGMEVATQVPQVRIASRSGGADLAVPLSDSILRTVKARWTFYSAADRGFFEGEALRMAHGAAPCVFVPWDTEPLVVYGRAKNGIRLRRDLPTGWSGAELEVIEAAHPVVAL